MSHPHERSRNLAVVPLKVEKRTASASRGATRYVVLGVVVAISALDPMQWGIPASQASDFPRFVAQPQISTMQQALLAYSASALTEDPRRVPSFIGSGAARALNSAMLPLAAPMPGFGPELSTFDFHETMLKARRDAGDARALADVVSRRAAAISERMLAGHEPQVPEGALATAAAAEPSQSQELAQHFAFAAAAPFESIPVENPPKVQAAAPQTRTAPPVAGSPVGAKSPSDKAAVALAESESASDPVAGVAKPAPLPRPALPGRMTLGARVSADDASLDRGAAPLEGSAGENLPLPSGVGIIPPRAGASVIAIRTVPVMPASALSVDGEGASGPAQSAPDEPRKSQAAATSFAPLAPPKDRSGQAESKSKGNEESRHPESKKLKADPRSTGPSAAQPTAVAQRTPAAPPAEPAKQESWLFSWFKPSPPAKGFAVPKEIGAFGWTGD